MDGPQPEDVILRLKLHSNVRYTKMESQSKWSGNRYMNGVPLFLDLLNRNCLDRTLYTCRGAGRSITATYLILSLIS